MAATEFITFELATNWLTGLAKKLLKVRADRKQEFDALANTFGDPLELANFYVEPECQQFNPADYNEDDSYHVIRESIFTHVAQFLSGKTDRKGKHLFILSDAGTGKTSFLVMLKLADISAFWPSQLKCVLLKIGPTTLEDIAKIETKPTTILLLDALDEDAGAWNELEHRVRDLLAATQVFHRTIITCRSQFIELRQDPFMRRGRVELYGELCPVVYMSLFNEKQVRRCIQQRFESKANDAEWARKAQNVVEQMGSLRMRPMLLAHIDDFIESQQTSWDLYGIYSTLVAAWLLREQKKAFAATREVIDPQELLFCCQRVAIYMLATGMSRLSRDELERVGQFYSGIRRVTLKQFGVRSLLTTDTEGRFRFSHFSVLEFLAVKAAIDGLSIPNILAMQSTDLMREFLASWIVGHTDDAENIARLRYLGLQGASFRNKELRGINFSGFDCSGADFSNADLSGSNFSKATLLSTSFLNADLSRSNFDATKLAGTTFDFANLTETSFQLSEIRNSTFRHCDLGRTLFDGATADSRAAFREASIPDGFQHPRYLEDQRGNDPDESDM